LAQSSRKPSQQCGGAPRQIIEDLIRSWEARLRLCGCRARRVNLAGKGAISGSPSLVSRTLTLLRWAPRAVARAGLDAGRAWAITPNRYRVSAYTQDKSGGWHFVRRRRFRRNEVLKLKIFTAARVFVASIKAGTARSVVIRRYPEEGLAANLLHVLEVVRRLRPDAGVRVDWALSGSELGFRYGGIGDDVWAQLFRHLGPRSDEEVHEADFRLDFAFWGTGKDHLTGKRLRDHRNVYSSIALNWLEIISRRVLDEVRRIHEQFLDGRFCIGVHRRVGNALVADLQSKGYVASLDALIKAIESLLSALSGQGAADHAIFLATDDAEAVAAFRCVFGSKLTVRNEVQRTTSDAPEVHFRDWGRLSIADAEDVLIDAILLSKCNVLVHASSSVSTLASIMNPSLALIRI
jgi:hypothetical protein